MTTLFSLLVSPTKVGRFAKKEMANLPTLTFSPQASTLSPTYSSWTISLLFETLSPASQYHQYKG